MEDSVSDYLRELRAGNQEAAAELWNLCFNDLVGMARRKLSGVPLRVTDEEDVALSVLDSLFRGLQQGRFEQLHSKDDLWPLLVVMTRQKVVSRIRLHQRQRRGGGQVRGDSIFAGSDQRGFDQLARDDFEHVFEIVLNEQIEMLLESLPDERSRDIARMRLQGFLNREIANHLQITEAAVRRKLNLIRNLWDAVARK